MPFPIDIKYIRETEHELGVQFPEKFISKMTQDNGGAILTLDEEYDEEIVWSLFPFFDKSDRKRMSRTCNHLVLETKNMREWDTFPSNGIAIASDGSGNCLLLLPQEGNPQKLQDNIYMWNHETGMVVEIASSIQDLNLDS